jgi:hypothetical protein
MKCFSTITLLILLACSCTNETSNNTVSSTTDTIPPTTVPETTNPTPKTKSKYTTLTTSIYSGKVAKHQAKAFVTLVEPKQKNLKATTNDFVVRRDTLYEVQYLPFKDQELYLHTIAIEQTKDKDVLTNWCFSILKNGSIMVEDQLISADFFLSLGLEKMNVGDTDLVFIGTKEDGTTETFRIPYDGKKDIKK